MKKILKILGKSILRIVLGIFVILGILLIIICNDYFKFCFNNDGKKYCYDIKLDAIERVYYYDENNKNIFIRETDTTDFNEDETVYYGDGNILLESKYDKKGEKNAEFMYYKNGQIMKSSNSKNWKNHGKITMYYKNGNIFLEGNYDNGEKIGIWTGYNEAGEIEKVLNYEDLEGDNDYEKYLEQKNKNFTDLVFKEINGE